MSNKQSSIPIEWDLTSALPARTVRASKRVMPEVLSQDQTCWKRLDSFLPKFSRIRIFVNVYGMKIDGDLFHLILPAPV